MKCRRLSLCHRKDLVQQDLRGWMRFLKSFVIKSSFHERNLVVVFADSEGLGDKQLYVGQQYSLSGVDQHKLPLHIDFKHHQTQNTHYHSHPKIRYNCARPLHPLQAANPFEAGNKNKRSGILQLERRGNSRIVPYIFLQMPEGNNR